MFGCIRRCHFRPQMDIKIKRCAYSGLYYVAPLLQTKITQILINPRKNLKGESPCPKIYQSEFSVSLSLYIVHSCTFVIYIMIFQSQICYLGFLLWLYFWIHRHLCPVTNVSVLGSWKLCFNSNFSWRTEKLARSNLGFSPLRSDLHDICFI